MSDKPAVSAEEVAEQIAGDIISCEKLLCLLEEEQKALKERDADSLARIIEQKAENLTRLELSARKRSSWIATTGEEKESEAWQEFLANLNDTSFQKPWEQLKSLLEACREKNQINGKLLSRNQQVCGRLLEIMRGQVTAPVLYDQIGNSTGEHSSHGFGEA